MFLEKKSKEEKKKNHGVLEPVRDFCLVSV